MCRWPTCACGGEGRMHKAVRALHFGASGTQMCMHAGHFVQKRLAITGVVDSFHFPLQLSVPHDTFFSLPS